MVKISEQVGQPFVNVYIYFLYLRAVRGYLVAYFVGHGETHREHVCYRVFAKVFTLNGAFAISAVTRLP